MGVGGYKYPSKYDESETVHCGRICESKSGTFITDFGKHMSSVGLCHPSLQHIILLFIEYIFCVNIDKLCMIILWLI